MKKKTRKYPVLGIVDDEYASRRRAYIVLSENPLENEEAIARFESLNWIVINADEDRPADEVDLRVHLPALCAADDIILPTDTWWTSVRATQLQWIASQLRLAVYDYSAAPVETVGLVAR